MKTPNSRNSQMEKLLNLIHDLNQPLTAIKAYLGGCELRLQKNDLHPKQMIEVLQKINEHTELLKNKIEFMKELSAQDQLIEPVNLQSMILEIISLYSYEIEHHKLNLILNFEKNFPNLRINPFQVKQILFRLLTKCIYAIEQNKISEAKIEIQTIKDQNTAKIIIKSYFLIRKEDFESDLAYCRSFLNLERSSLSAELFADSIVFQLIIVN
ncbi:histidine kinase [Legionella sp. WA2024007413]